MPEIDIDPLDFDRRLAEALAGPLDRMGRESVREARRNTPDHPSTPGAQARDSIEHEVDRAGSTMRFGSRLLKFRFLELGTRHYAPRATLRRTLDELGPRYLEILRRG